MDVGERLAAIVRDLYAAYREHGYHTFAYWMRFDGASAQSDLLADLIEELYPAEWAAAWEPYADDETVLSRDPKPLASE